MKPKYYIFKHPVFICSLLLLIVNDHYLKAAYHNIITGKLSDIAGLFIFPIFWAVVFPRYKKHIYWITAIGFTLWKSELPQPLIAFFNHYHIPLTRVVDYSDLFALIVLIPSYFFFDKTKPANDHRLITLPVAVISLIAFCATSPPGYFSYVPHQTQQISYGKYKTKLSKQEVLQKLNKMNIAYNLDSFCTHTSRMPHLIEMDSKYCDTCTIQEYILISGYQSNHDTLKQIFLRHETIKKHNYIRVLGYRYNSNNYTIWEEDKAIIKRYAKTITKELIPSIIE